MQSWALVLLSIRQQVAISRSGGGAVVQRVVRPARETRQRDAVFRIVLRVFIPLISSHNLFVIWN